MIGPAFTVHVRFVTHNPSIIVDEEFLYGLFAQYGEILDISIRRYYRQVRRQYGYAFVEYKVKADATRASSVFQQFESGGVRLYSTISHRSVKSWSPDGQTDEDRSSHMHSNSAAPQSSNYAYKSQSSAIANTSAVGQVTPLPITLGHPNHIAPTMSVNMGQENLHSSAYYSNYQSGHSTPSIVPTLTVVYPPHGFPINISNQQGTGYYAHTVPPPPPTLTSPPSHSTAFHSPPTTTMQPYSSPHIVRNNNINHQEWHRYAIVTSSNPDISTSYVSPTMNYGNPQSSPSNSHHSNAQQLLQQATSMHSSNMFLHHQAQQQQHLQLQHQQQQQQSLQLSQQQAQPQLHPSAQVTYYTYAQPNMVAVLPPQNYAVNQNANTMSPMSINSIHNNINTNNSIAPTYHSVRSSEQGSVQPNVGLTDPVNTRLASSQVPYQGARYNNSHNHFSHNRPTDNR